MESKKTKMKLTNFHISTQEYERLSKYCTKNKCCSYASIIREAISKYLDEKENK